MIYILENRETNWGDFGSLLVSGMVFHLERLNGLLQIERSGPYVPPLIDSGLGNIIVRDDVKRMLEASGLSGIEYKPVIKKHIVEIHWDKWDLQSEEPPYCPESGEPEDYILDAEHSEIISAQIGDLWELIIPETGTFRNNLFVEFGPPADIFKADNKGYVFLTEKAKIWIEHNAGEWVTFEKMEDGKSCISKK